MTNEMPKEIWAWDVDDNGNIPFNTNGALKHPDAEQPTKYHRDDVVAEKDAEIEMLRDALAYVLDNKQGSLEHRFTVGQMALDRSLRMKGQGND